MSNLQPQETAQPAQKSKLTVMLDASARQAERLGVAARADQCVKWLKAQGFDVVCVQSTRHNPRIIIRHSPLCEALEGAVRMYERLGHVEVRYWFAIQFDCEVRWTDMGGEA